MTFSNAWQRCPTDLRSPFGLLRITVLIGNPLSASGLSTNNV